jgi:hypothetical protein
MVEFVGAIICIISPKLIERPEGDDSEADGIDDGGGGGGISGEDSSEEEDSCGGGGGGGNSSSGGGGGGVGGFSDCSNCNDGDNAGSKFDIALYIIIEFFINS